MSAGQLGLAITPVAAICSMAWSFSRASSKREHSFQRQSAFPVHAHGQLGGQRRGCTHQGQRGSKWISASAVAYRRMAAAPAWK